MFKLDGTYTMCASDLHGWNTSVNYCIDSTGGDIQGDYTNWYTMPGTEMDYSHVTQTGFFVTVEGTQQDTVLYAGDRWADFAWNGIGYNQWVPITKEGGGYQFHSMSQWQFNATTGEWRVGQDNNYILNPDFQADRISVSNLRGWDNAGGSVGNVEPGANGSRFALQVSNSGSTSQQIDVPAGTYSCPWTPEEARAESRSSAPMGPSTFSTSRRREAGTSAGSPTSSCPPEPPPSGSGHRARAASKSTTSTSSERTATIRLP
ncbi:hypothetical protein GCM10029992_50500 [Glycomyces albus]